MAAIGHSANYLLPPYRCCGVSTRLATQGSWYKKSGKKRGRICDICGWSYKSDGTGRRRFNIKKHDRTEIDK